jgi:hypothetical protein
MFSATKRRETGKAGAESRRRWRLAHPTKRTFLRYAAPVLAVYLVLLGGLYVAMLQPPAVFGRVMSKLPAFSYFLFPFEPMWLMARRGHLKVGDAAPDFALKTAGGSDLVTLASFRGHEPVVLIFGSHT